MSYVIVNEVTSVLDLVLVLVLADNNDKSVYLIIGITVAGLIVLAVITFVIVYRIKKRRQSVPSHERVSYHRGHQAISGIYEDIPG